MRTSTSEPRIQRANAADAGRLAEIFIAARAGMTYLPVLHTDAETRAFIAQLVAEREAWLAALDGVAVGFVVVGEGWVDHLYVDPLAQNAGVGSRLLAHAKARQPQGLRLWVFQANAGAQRFYVRHGFMLERRTDGRDNEEGLPDALYIWRGERRVPSGH